MFVRRLFAILALALGLFGLVACAAGVYAVWRVEARLQWANDRVFTLFDDGLGAVRDRVVRVRDRVEASKITSSEITQKVRAWTTREAKELVAAELEIAARAENLTAQIQTADALLETSADSVRDVQRILELSRSLGGHADPASLDEVLETLTVLRGDLREVGQAADEVRGFTTTLAGESDENRVARIARALGRIAATFTQIGPRLDQFAARLSELRAEADQLEARTSTIIRRAAVGATIVLAWVALGQLALCVWGRRSFARRSPIPQPAA